MFLINDAQAYGLPLSATDVAVAWDHLYLFLFWLSVFFFILVVGGMIYLAFRYRKQPNQQTAYIVDNHKLEAFWTVIPTILLMVIFAWGWSVYKDMTRAPVDSLEIRVIGKQWLWNFQYDDGRVLTNELFVPQNRPVKLVMSSEDVLHSFFVPNFRVKSDVVPGMYTSVWFQAKLPGQHQVFCTEYCGTSHSLMLAKLNVLEPEKWEKWRRGQTVEVTGVQLASATTAASGAPAVASLPDQGKKLTEQKGCLACHSSDGSQKTGPSYSNAYGKKREFSDGSVLEKTDESYLRESILNPQAKVVKGFGPVMPSYQGLVNETELNAIVSYIKSLNERG